MVSEMTRGNCHFIIPTFFHLFCTALKVERSEEFNYDWRLMKSLGELYISPIFLFNKSLIQEHQDLKAIFPNLIFIREKLNEESTLCQNNKEVRLRVKLDQFGMMLNFKGNPFLVRMTTDENYIGFIEILSIGKLQKNLDEAYFLLKNLYVMLKT